MSPRVLLGLQFISRLKISGPLEEMVVLESKLCGSNTLAELPAPSKFCVTQALPQISRNFVNHIWQSYVNPTSWIMTGVVWPKQWTRRYGLIWQGEAPYSIPESDISGQKDLIQQECFHCGSDFTPGNFVCSYIDNESSILYPKDYIQKILLWWWCPFFSFRDWYVE